MSVTCYSLGAAQEVTGSKHILEVDGRSFMVDCGAFQGKRSLADKKNREFKQRLEETEQNEEADIRSFTFHKHELNKNRGGHESFDRSGKDRKDRKEFSRDKNRKDFKRGGKREFGKKGFDRKKRFDDDED